MGTVGSRLSRGAEKLARALLNPGTEMERKFREYQLKKKDDGGNDDDINNNNNKAAELAVQVPEGASPEYKRALIAGTVLFGLFKLSQSRFHPKTTPDATDFANAVSFATKTTSTIPPPLPLEDTTTFISPPQPTPSTPFSVLPNTTPTTIPNKTTKKMFKARNQRIKNMKPTVNPLLPRTKPRKLRPTIKN